MMLSESQERMLIVARTGREKEVVEIFNKWDLDCVVIGKVVEGDRLKIMHSGRLEADLPVAALTDEAPKYERPILAPNRPSAISETRTPKTSDLTEALRLLLASSNICSKRWVYEQYDSMVRTNTIVLPGADAAVIRVKETRRAIAMCHDGNGRFVAIDPRMGAKLAVAEAARNVACVGARPVAVTNCLNFASPERPEVMWAFSEVIDGMAEACRAFDTPVVSGNVSFYNETDGKGILPTPVIGMVGLIEDSRKIVNFGFKSEGDLIAVLGTTRDDLAASEYAQTVLGLSTQDLVSRGVAPKVDLHEEKRLQEVLLHLIDGCLINSAHDCSDGGLAVTIAESCFSSLGRHALGAEVDLAADGLSAESLLFGETPSRVVISFEPEKLERLKGAVGPFPFAVIGRVTGSTLSILIDGSPAVEAPVAELESSWANALSAQLQG
jgi:phosphoribosylformylglycinamidine synthase